MEDKTMKKKIIKIIFGIIIIFSLMFMEYRVIMKNIRPYIGENNTVYIEVFGQVDEYIAEDGGF
jgi:hypothetical protein